MGMLPIQMTAAVLGSVVCVCVCVSVCVCVCLCVPVYLHAHMPTCPPAHIEVYGLLVFVFA